MHNANSIERENLNYQKSLTKKCSKFQLQDLEQKLYKLLLLQIQDSLKM